MKRCLKLYVKKLKDGLKCFTIKLYNEKVQNPQVRFYLQFIIERMKHWEVRFCITILISCLTDIVLFTFYFYQSILALAGNAWRFTNAALYLLLLIGKINIYLMGKQKKYQVSVRKTSAIVLILIGIFAMSRTYQYITSEKVLIFPNTIYILNGSILVIRMVTRIMNNGMIPKEYCLLNTYRQAYVWTENMIAFSILFSNLIEMYQWGDNDLTLSNILFGQAIGLGVLIIGIYLLKTSHEVTSDT